MKKRNHNFLGAGLAAIMNPPEEMFSASTSRNPTQFTLVYELPDGEDVNIVVERLGAAGLADALVDFSEPDALQCSLSAGKFDFFPQWLTRLRG